MISLRNKLWGGFASLAVILLAVSILSVLVFTRYSRTLERVFRENYDSAVYMQAMQQSLDRLDDRAQRMMWDASMGAHPDAGTAESDFEAALHAQQGNCNLPGEAEVTRQLADAWMQYRDRFHAFENVPAPERADHYRRELLPRRDDLKAIAQRIADMNTSAMVSVDGQAKRTLLTVRNALLVLVLVGMVLAAVVIWTVTLTIFRPLIALTESARQIEAGNLDLELPAHPHDEIGRLSGAFNSMASRLREFKRLDHDRLTRTQQTAQLAIDSLADAVLVIGPGGEIEICNAAAQTYFGIEPGRHITSFNLKWLPPLHDEVVARGQPSNPVGYRSAIQLFIEGEERFLLPKAVPMRSIDGRKVGVTVILVDVTQLRHVDEAKSSLVSTVSHELRTPLTSQRLVLGLLLEAAGPNLPANQRRMLEVAKADSDRLYRTIEDLLSISRMESGRFSFHFRPIDPSEVVRATVDPLRPLLADKKLTLKLNVAPGLPMIQADPATIGPALANLLSNAMKYTPPGGDIAVKIEAVDTTVVFTVADSGPGILPEYRDRIFEKFFRVPSQSGPAGAGLGLSIAKEIIEAHGGHVSLKCPEGGGSAFSFSVPVVAPKPQPALSI